MKQLPRVAIVTWAITLAAWNFSPTSMRSEATPSTVGVLKQDTADTFSQEWLEEYSGAKVGCVTGRGVYKWRPAGFGSNINVLLVAWVKWLSIDHWQDLAIVVEGQFLHDLECQSDTGDKLRGWECMFAPMPHVCLFGSIKAWERHMNRHRISPADKQKAHELIGLHDVWNARGSVHKALEGTGFDALSAGAVLFKYLWSNMSPWMRREMDSVLQQDRVATIRESPFIGLHVRRGDKVEWKEAKAVPTEDYLKAAADFYLEAGQGVSAESIRGIWLASDDPTVLGELMDLAPKYFPNVESDKIIWTSAGLDEGPHIDGVRTTSRTQDFPGQVLLSIDLEQMAASDLFVGTYSSNIGKLVHVMREAEGQPRNTTISMDQPIWHPGRRSLRY